MSRQNSYDMFLCVHGSALDLLAAGCSHHMITTENGRHGTRHDSCFVFVVDGIMSP